MRILFICTGNICRSPFAAGFARRIRPDVDSLSAGTYAFPGRQATPEAVAAAADFDVDLSGHQSTQLTADLIRSVDLIYVATSEHLEEVRALVPEAPVALIDPLGEPIVDPYGRAADVYHSSFEHISRAVQERLQLQS